MIAPVSRQQREIRRTAPSAEYGAHLTADSEPVSEDPVPANTGIKVCGGSGFIPERGESVAVASL